MLDDLYREICRDGVPIVLIVSSIHFDGPMARRGGFDSGWRSASAGGNRTNEPCCCEIYKWISKVTRYKSVHSSLVRMMENPDVV
jgi:hypothetical protein